MVFSWNGLFSPSFWGTLLFFIAGLALICFILPATLTLAFSELLYKLKWIKPGDLTLDR